MVQTETFSSHPSRSEIQTHPSIQVPWFTVATNQWANVPQILLVISDVIESTVLSKALLSSCVVVARQKIPLNATRTNERGLEWLKIELFKGSVFSTKARISCFNFSVWEEKLRLTFHYVSIYRVWNNNFGVNLRCQECLSMSEMAPQLDLRGSLGF